MVSHADVRNTQLDDLYIDHQRPVRRTQQHSAVQLFTSNAGTAGGDGSGVGEKGKKADTKYQGNHELISSWI